MIKIDVKVSTGDADAALAEYERDASETVPRVLREVAEPLASRMRAAVPRGPDRGGHWSTQIRAAVDRRGAYVEWADDVYPPLVEFRPRWGGRPTVGRYVQPLVDRSEPEAGEAVDRALDDVGRRAGLD